LFFLKLGNFYFNLFQNLSLLPVLNIQFPLIYMLLASFHLHVFYDLALLEGEFKRKGSF